MTSKCLADHDSRREKLKLLQFCENVSTTNERITMRFVADIHVPHTLVFLYSELYRFTLLLPLLALLKYTACVFSAIISCHLNLFPSNWLYFFPSIADVATGVADFVEACYIFQIFLKKANGFFY